MRVTGQANVVAHILIKLHDNGAMSVEGNIGDLRMALAMLDGAKDALSSKLGKPTTLEPHGAGLVLPPSYTNAIKPNETVFPVQAEADNAVDAPHSRAKAEEQGKDWLR